MTLPVARDALTQVLGTPTAAALWQRLSALVNGLNQDDRAGMLAGLARQRFDHPSAQWLHYATMAGLSGDPGWFAHQAALVDERTPADAIVTLLLLARHHAMVATHNHADFEQVLRQADAVRLQRCAARRVASGTPRPAPARPGLRVAVYTPDVASNFHGGTTFTLNVLSVLISRGIEARGFAGQESDLPSAAAYCSGKRIAPSPVHLDSLRLHGDGQTEINLASNKLSLPAGLASLFNLLHDYRPDVVLFVGYLSPVPYSLYEHYPVVGLSVHAVAPLVPLDVWLKPAAEAHATPWPSLPAAATVEFPARFWPGGAVTALPRASAGLPDQALLLLTSGTRLSTEMGAGWVRRMVRLVETKPGVHWILVGVKQGTQLPGVPQHPRIHLHPVQANLAQWLAMGDIYANPPRLGGGGTVVMAMEQGLAVAAYAATDGGDKVGAGAAASDDDYMALLESWLDDAAARRAAGLAMRQRFSARFDMSAPLAAERLVQACHQAVGHFNERKEAARESDLS